MLCKLQRSVQCAVCNVHCALCFVQCTLCIVHCAASVQCALCSTSSINQSLSASAAAACSKESLARVYNSDISVYSVYISVYNSDIRVNRMLLQLCPKSFSTLFLDEDFSLSGKHMFPSSLKIMITNTSKRESLATTNIIKRLYINYRIDILLIRKAEI